MVPEWFRFATLSFLCLAAAVAACGLSSVLLVRDALWRLLSTPPHTLLAPSLALSAWLTWKFASILSHSAYRRAQGVPILPSLFSHTISLGPSVRSFSALTVIWSAPGIPSPFSPRDFKSLFLLILTEPCFFLDCLAQEPGTACTLIPDFDSGRSLHIFVPFHAMSDQAPQWRFPSPEEPLPATVSYAEHTPDDAVTCPICHEPVIADAVTFSCHKHVPYCADCVATWVWRCVTTFPRLNGYPSCPHCRTMVVVDHTFKPDRGRWLEEDVVTRSEGPGGAAATAAAEAIVPRGPDSDWYERFLLGLDDEDNEDYSDGGEMSTDEELYGPNSRSPGGGANAVHPPAQDGEQTEAETEAEDDNELSELDDEDYDDDFNDLSEIDRPPRPRRGDVSTPPDC